MEPIIIGHYRCVEYLGAGTFAEVYRAQDITLNREVAVKILKPILATAPQYQEMFQKEAQLVSTLFHQRIATLLEYGEEQGRIYLVMRYVAGANLAEVIAKRGKLPWDEALRILRETAEGLDYAHQQGLVHGDIKPQNILVHPREGAVLTDFGLARMVEVGSVKGSLGVRGTPAYISPEVWDGQPASPASDQYALGCVLAEMLSGKALFEASTPWAAMKLHSQPPALPQWPAGAPAGLGEVLRKALAQAPQQRFESVLAFCAALQAPPPPKPAPRIEVVSPPRPAAQPQTRVREKDGMVEVYISAGEFLMGSKDGSSDELPQHKVYLDAYWMDQTPVTNAMFVRFLNERGNQQEGGRDWYFEFLGEIKQNGKTWRVESGFEQHPVVGVSWYAARAYAAWVGAKLPTEAQWEKAARGADGRTYPWGNQEPDATLANFNENIGGTTPVGSYPGGASPYGLLDMAGNVDEWCADWYGETYYKVSPPRNPAGPASGSDRIIRGGSWGDASGFVRAASRYWSGPTFASKYFGFRCAR